jgi:ATP-binding cassette subfamily B (MDR/TAP) protein 1
MRAFTCLLRQEVAYFDRTENRSGAICTRLSSDALDIQQIAGPRIGVIFETLSIFFFGLLLGFLFSPDLTLVVFFYLIITLGLAYFAIRWEIIVNQKTSSLLEQASSVRSNCH